MAKTINVFITDGNRLCNYDCSPETKLSDLLEQREFRWMKGSVRINGTHVFDREVQCSLAELQAKTASTNPFANHMRITCMTPPDDQTKKTIKARKKGEPEDVR